MTASILVCELGRPFVGCYALTAEELDFIINYDTRLRRGFGGQVKYRLGRDAGGEVG